MLRRYVLGLVAALAIAGCAQGMRTSSEGVQETLVTSSATVESVDQSTRQVVLRDNADGAVFTVTAGPEVRNLAQVEAGDQVRSTSTRRSPPAWPTRPTPARPRPPSWPAAPRRARGRAASRRRPRAWW